MADPGITHETMVFYKSEEEFKELEQAMLAAIQQIPKSKPQRPSLAKEPSDQEIEEYLKLGQDAYDCGELAFSLIYAVLERMQVDWIPLVKARIALGDAFLGLDLPMTLKKAVESYQEHPEEVDAYLAMAQIMSLVNSPFQARQWFDLYKKGVQNVPPAHLEIEKRIDHEVRSFCQAEGSVLKVLTTPEALENVKNLPSISKLWSHGDAQESVKRIQENPCVETWRREFGKSVHFRFLALRLCYVCADLGLYPFPVMDEQELSQSLLAEGGVFSKWDQKLVTHLCTYFNDSATIARMQQTCRPLRQMFDHESVWAAHTDMLRSALSMRVASPGLPSKFFGDMRLSTKSLFKALFFYTIFIIRMSSMSPADLEPEPSAKTIATLHSMIETFNYGLFGFKSPFALLMSRVVDMLALDENCSRVVFGGITPLLMRSALLDSTLNTAVLDYFSTLALRHPDPSNWAPSVQATIFLQNAMSIERSCATLAALESAVWMKQFEIRCLTPSSFSTNLLGVDLSYFDLEGLYHTHLHYTRAELHGCHETGILELSSDESGKFNGKGFDTIGKFHFDACPISTDEPFSWTQTYEDGATLEFNGILQPSGFGGCVRDPSRPDFPIIAYWFMCKDKLENSAALLEKFAEAVRVDKQKKQTWAIQNPLEFVQGEPSLLEIGVAYLNRTRAELQWLATPQIPWYRIRKLLEELPPGSSRDVDFPRGAYELDFKYNLRKEAYLKIETRAFQTRIELIKLYHSQFLELYLIIKNPEHPQYATTVSKLVYLLSAPTSGEFDALVEAIPKLAMGSLDNNTEGTKIASELVVGAVQRKHKRGNRTNFSPTTILSIAAIGVAVLSVGAFLVARALKSKMNPQSK